MGLKMSDLEALDIGTVFDMMTEYDNDSCEYKEIASQEDFDKF